TASMWIAVPGEETLPYSRHLGGLSRYEHRSGESVVERLGVRGPYHRAGDRRQCNGVHHTQGDLLEARQGEDSCRGIALSERHAGGDGHVLLDSPRVGVQDQLL